MKLSRKTSFYSKSRMFILALLASTAMSCDTNENISLPPEESDDPKECSNVLSTCASTVESVGLIMCPNGTIFNLATGDTVVIDGDSIIVTEDASAGSEEVIVNPSTVDKTTNCKRLEKVNPN